jgi:hypothetical protein
MFIGRLPPRHVFIECRAGYLQRFDDRLYFQFRIIHHRERLLDLPLVRRSACYIFLPYLLIGSDFVRFLRLMQLENGL